MAGAILQRSFDLRTTVILHISIWSDFYNNSLLVRQMSLKKDHERVSAYFPSTFLLLLLSDTQSLSKAISDLFRALILLYSNLRVFFKHYYKLYITFADDKDDFDCVL